MRRGPSAVDAPVIDFTWPDRKNNPARGGMNSVASSSLMGVSRSSRLTGPILRNGYGPSKTCALVADALFGRSQMFYHCHRQKKKKRCYASPFPSPPDRESGRSPAGSSCAVKTCPKFSPQDSFLLLDDVVSNGNLSVLVLTPKGRDVGIYERVGCFVLTRECSVSSLLL